MFETLLYYTEERKVISRTLGMVLFFNVSSLVCLLIGRLGLFCFKKVDQETREDVQFYILDGHTIMSVLPDGDNDNYSATMILRDEFGSFAWRLVCGYGQPVVSPTCRYSFCCCPVFYLSLFTRYELPFLVHQALA